MTALTWALVIATKDRLPVLRHCVRLALAQSRPPSEVIVIDASAEWEAHKTEVGDMLKDHSDVTFYYGKATRPSVTIQRNQGIEAATADILFLIDDDSLLYGEAAEEIMRVYEADTDQTLAGVQLQAVADLPEQITDLGAQKSAVPRNRRSGSGRFRRLTRRLLQYGLEARFVPYTGSYPDLPLPAFCTPPDIRRARLFAGFRMTLRRKVARDLMFDPNLLFYCPGEDLDLSYRASQVGALVTAMKARVHHFTSASGRLKRQQVTTLAALNQATFLRRHAPDQAWARRAYTRSMLHRAFGDVFRDLELKAYDLPGMRGTLRGLWLARAVFRASPEDLSRTYPAQQEQIIRTIKS